MTLTLDMLFNPTVVYGAAITALIMSMSLFAAAKRELGKVRTVAVDPGTDRTMVEGLESEIETLRQSVRQLEDSPAQRAGGIGINLTKRSKALRMHRRGESIPSIAAALETPSNEIALLLKVTSMTGEKHS